MGDDMIDPQPMPQSPGREFGGQGSTARLELRICQTLLEDLCRPASPFDLDENFQGYLSRIRSTQRRLPLSSNRYRSCMTAMSAAAR